MSAFDMHPRGVGEVLSDAWGLYARNAIALITLVACVVVPLQILWVIVAAATVHHGSDVTRSLFSVRLHTSSNGSSNSGGYWLAALVQTLGDLLATAACVRALADAAAGGDPSVARSIAEAARRLPGLIGLYILRSIGVIIGLILIIVPGVWAAVSWSTSVPAFMLEGAGPMHALGRSTHLVRRNWWHAFGVVVLCDILVAISAGIIAFVFGFIDGYSSHPSLGAAIAAAAIGSTVAAVLVQPFNAAVRTVLYLDLRVRHGGDEAEALAGQLGLAPEAAPLDY